MCYSGRCQWEDHMGDCRKYYDWKLLPCPTDFDITVLKDGKAVVTPYDICGGPDEPITFDSEEQAVDYVNAQRFAYKLLVKTLESKG